MKNLKINIPVRLQNPWFWVGLLGVMLSAVGMEPEMFTSWATVWEAIKGVALNPYQLVCVATAVLGVFIDPTTKGVGDSQQALGYKRPKV